MPVTFFVNLPLMQVIVFLATTGEPAITIFAVEETGAKVAVPPCVAVTAQFPDLKRFKVEPDIEQIVGVEVENNIPAPLDALADKTTDLLDKFTLLVGEKVIVCGSRETSNETVYRSD